MLEGRDLMKERETNDVKFPVLSEGGTTGRGVVRESIRTLKSPALTRRKEINSGQKFGEESRARERTKSEV